MRETRYRRWTFLVAACLIVAAGLSTAWTRAQAPADHPSLRFSRDVRPILESRCASCHAGTNRKGGFSLETRESLLQGGRHGPAAVPGDATGSLLMQLVTAEHEDDRMPADGPALSETQVALLRMWIEQGLPWDEDFRFGEDAWQPPLLPREVQPPDDAGAALSNPIDLFLAPYLAERGVETLEVVDDRLFARRVTLDLIGLLPTPEQLEAFLADTAPDKRERLVRALLADRHAYAIHWMTFWNDALRNAYRGTGFIDGGRMQITPWLYQSLHENKPYDRFVRELVNPVPGSEGFIKGIVWRGVVNASQTPQMQASQNIGQVFMGVNLKCASCHDSFINHWKLADAYALAAVFAQETLELNRCDKPLGEYAVPGFIYPELGTIDPSVGREERIEKLAEILTGQDNGRLARTMVNRLWAHFFGIGLVEPVDEMDHEPWHADLLDYLAWDFQQNGYDLKRTMALITTSRAYQMRSAPAPAPGEKEFTFNGPVVRRMTAEQFVDAVAMVTDVWPAAMHAPLGEEVAAANGVRVRAALVHDDELMRALGRPNREQVVTRRESIATTLEALELTNGEILYSRLMQGATKWLEKDLSPARLVEGVFLTTLGRKPNHDERDAALEVVGSPATVEGLADLLWIIAMMPEFQLIH